MAFQYKDKYYVVSIYFQNKKKLYTRNMKKQQYKSFQ